MHSFTPNATHAKQRGRSFASRAGWKPPLASNAPTRTCGGYASVGFGASVCAVSFTRTLTVDAFFTRTTKPLDTLPAVTGTVVRESVHRHGSITAALGSFTHTANWPAARSPTLKLPFDSEAVVAVVAVPAVPPLAEIGVTVTVPLLIGLAAAGRGIALI